MADKYISDLTEATDLDASDWLEIENVAGNSRKIKGRLVRAGWRLAGGAYTAAGVWDQALDGSAANIIFTGLTGCNDIRVIMSAVTKSVSGAPVLEVSVNNGSSYYTASGDYVFADTAGARSNATSMGQFHLTNTTAARDGVVEVRNARLALPYGVNVTVQASHRYFLASSSPIDAVRVTPTGGGNFTGGKCYCLIR